MKVSELKEILKPLIKECIKEVLLQESGVLSHIIKETVQATAFKEAIKEEKQNFNMGLGKRQEPKKDPKELLKEMLNKKGRGVYGDVFEGIQPLKESRKVSVVPADIRGLPGSESVQSPLSGYAPDDPGVDIDRFFKF